MASSACGHVTGDEWGMIVTTERTSGCQRGITSFHVDDFKQHRWPLWHWCAYHDRYGFEVRVSLVKKGDHFQPVKDVKEESRNSSSSTNNLSSSSFVWPIVNVNRTPTTYEVQAIVAGLDASQVLVEAITPTKVRISTRTVAAEKESKPAAAINTDVITAEFERNATKRLVFDRVVELPPDVVNMLANDRLNCTLLHGLLTITYARQSAHPRPVAIEGLTSERS